MTKKFILIALIPIALALVVVFAGIYRFNFTNDDIYVQDENGNIVKYDDIQSGDTKTPVSEETIADTEAGRIAKPETPENPPTGKIKADVFTGVLERVDTGCFADGECFVEVDGKHVTALMGWSRETVGSVVGVPGFGDLESHIGKNVEVYAQENPDGTYTLYGSEGFYIKLLDDSKPAPLPMPAVQGDCVIGGCSSQLCYDASLGDIMSTCEYREEYACYKSATCERQSTGQCGWTETAELTQCLSSAGETGLQVQ